MNPLIKQKWIDALRNGQYEQGKNNLKLDNKYCCLGVLTDIYLKEHNLKWTNRINKDKVGKFNCYAFLPEKIRDWAELPACDPTIGNYLATDLNDIQGLTFSEIADKIEQHL